MYTEFYGLTELPFELSPNPKYLLLTPRHREALANLQYGISSRKSLTLLVGEAGTGKTTLVHAALQSDSCRNARILHMANPALNRQEFIEFLARGFALSEEARHSKTALLDELEDVLVARRQDGVTTALVVDEAQALSDNLLEEIRLLANIESSNGKLLPLVLAGQPELAERLNQVSLRQLKQRVALRCTLGLLDLVETTAYIAGRIRIAGGNGSALFTHKAVAVVHQRSGGVPRTISVICDNALVNGFAAGVRPITPEIVEEVCNDFDLGLISGSADPTPSFQALKASALPNAAPRNGPAPAPPQAPVPGPTSTTLPDPADRLFADYGRRRRFSFF